MKKQGILNPFLGISIILLMLVLIMSSSTGTVRGQLTCTGCADCNTQILAASPGESVTLTADITGQIGDCIDFDGAESGVSGVTFDCGGNTIVGDGSSGEGIHIHDASNNNVIRNCPGVSGFYRGIYIADSTGNIVQDADFSYNSFEGIYLRYADSNTFTRVKANNTYVANGHGIHFYRSDDNVFTDIDASYNVNNGIMFEYGNRNSIDNVRVFRNDEKGIYIRWTSIDNIFRDVDITTGGYSAGLYVYGYQSARNDIDTSNHVDGKPILFYDDTYNPCPDGQTINPGSQYSQIAANGCSGFTIDGATLTDGLYIWYTADSYMYNIDSRESIMGIEAWRVDRTTFENITLIGNDASGIYHRYGDNNIYRNIISSRNEYGFDVGNSVGSSFENVTASWSREDGLTTWYASSMTMDEVRLLNNGVNGIELVFGSNNNVVRNSYIANNGLLGVLIRGSSSNCPSGSTFYNNYFNNDWNVNISCAGTVTFDSSMDCGQDNVMGCVCTGGNFWAHPDGSGYSQSCADSDSDNFCDNPYTVNFDSATLTDSIPLADVPGGCCDVTDRDGDGYDSEQCDGSDCNDDPSLFGETCYPGAPELCDNLDNDCSTVVDEDPVCFGKVRRTEETYPHPIEGTTCAEDSSTNLIYCFGGMNVSSTGNPQTDSIVEYDPATGTALLLNTKLPTRRDEMSCVENSATNLIYCFGGYWQEFTCTVWEPWGCTSGYTTIHHFRDILEFDPSTETLTVLSTQLPLTSAGEEFSCTEDSSTNLIYCFGGDSPESDAIFEFDPALGTTTMMNSVLPRYMKRLSCTEDSSTNLIYCFGGTTDRGATDEILEFDPSTDSLVTMPETLESRTSFHSCAEDSATNMIYCFSGGFAQVSEYDPSADSLRVTDAEFIYPRERLGCAEDSSSNNFYCFGGWRSTTVRYDDIYEYIPETGLETCAGDHDCTSPEICCSDYCTSPPECPSCDDGDSCTTDSCLGYGTCTPVCQNTPITSCQDGDGCCPAGCTEEDDDDCGGLVGWWTFDSQDISGDQALDKSGSDNHGTIHGTTPATGRVWEALFFDETDDYISVPDNPTLDPQEITISAWIRHDPTTQWHAIADKRDTDTDGYSMFINTGTSSLFFRVNSNTITGTTPLDDSEWHHVAGVYNGSTMKVYVDGLEENSVSSGAMTIDTSGSLNIGTRYTTESFFNGILDDVRIWNRSLSAQQIQYLYDSYFHEADDNPRDGCIEDHELVPAIDNWKYDSTTYIMTWVMEAVTLWSRGTGCVS